MLLVTGQISMVSLNSYFIHKKTLKAQRQSKTKWKEHPLRLQGYVLFWIWKSDLGFQNQNTVLLWEFRIRFFKFNISTPTNTYEPYNTTFSPSHYLQWLINANMIFFLFVYSSFIYHSSHFFSSILQLPIKHINYYTIILSLQLQLIIIV